MQRTNEQTEEEEQKTDISGGDSGASTNKGLTLADVFFVNKSKTTIRKKIVSTMASFAFVPPTFRLLLTCKEFFATEQKIFEGYRLPTVLSDTSASDEQGNGRKMYCLLVRTPNSRRCLGWLDPSKVMKDLELPKGACITLVGVFGVERFGEILLTQPWPQGVGYMLSDDQFDGLRNLHKVLSGISERQPICKPMADAMRDHIIDCGKKITLRRVQELNELREKSPGKRREAEEKKNSSGGGGGGGGAKAKKDGKRAKKKEDQNRKTSPDFISSLLDLHRKYAQVIHEQFNDDVLSRWALVQAFQQVVNDEPVDYLADSITEEDGSVFFVSSNAEMLSHEVDYIYRHTNNYDRDQLETILTECSKMFEFLSDKDLFIEFHTQQLALRLLGKSANTNEGGYFIFVFSSFLLILFPYTHNRSIPVQNPIYFCECV